MARPIWEDIPYTIPWWRRLFKAIRYAPYDYFDRLNTIIDYFEWTCTEDWTIFVHVFLPAAGELVLGLLSFDWDDVARGFLRPYGAVGRKTLVASPELAKWEFEVPELGEEIGKRIPGAKFIKANRWWGKTRFLWQIDAFVQRGLYYWLLVDLVSEFLYNYSTGVLRSEVCAQGGIRCRGGPYGQSGYPGRYDLAAFVPENECIKAGPLSEGIRVGGNAIVADRPFKLLVDVELVPVFPVECRMRYRVSLRDSAGRYLVRSPPCATWKEDEKSALFVARVTNPGRYLLTVEITYSTCYTAAQVIHNVVIK